MKPVGQKPESEGIVLPKSSTIFDVADLHARMAARLAAGEPVVADVDQVATMDTAAVQLLLSAKRSCREGQFKLMPADCPVPVLAVLADLGCAGLAF